jgi:hypothetical protein
VKEVNEKPMKNKSRLLSKKYYTSGSIFIIQFLSMFGREYDKGPQEKTNNNT